MLLFHVDISCCYFMLIFRVDISCCYIMLLVHVDIVRNAISRGIGVEWVWSTIWRKFDGRHGLLAITWSDRKSSSSSSATITWSDRKLSLSSSLQSLEAITNRHHHHLCNHHAKQPCSVVRIFMNLTWDQHLQLARLKNLPKVSGRELVSYPSRKYRWGTWVYRRGWPGSRGWSRPTGNTCGACSSKWRSIQEDGKLNSRIKMAKTEKDSRIFWGNEENPKKRMMLRITWFSQQTSKQTNVTNMNKQTNTTVRWESLDIFWVSIERGNSWVGDVFPNLGNNFARHPDHFSSQLVSSRPTKKFGWQIT